MSNPNTMAVNMSIKLATRKLTMSPNDFKVVGCRGIGNVPYNVWRHFVIQTLEDWHRLVLD